MKIEPINIKIKDNWKYGEIAFLVDRDDFLKDVVKIRKQLGIKELIPCKEVHLWFSKLYSEETERDLKEKRKLPGRTAYIMPTSKTEKIFNKLLVKYRKPPIFLLPIRYAVLSGTVTDKECSNTAYCDVLYPEIPIKSPKVAIIIHPETKLSEIKKLFKNKAPLAIKEYQKYVLKTKRKPPDTISNIRRDRNWYWLKKQGMSYKQICEQAEKEGEVITRDGVIKAIKQYRERLAVEL